MKMRSIIMLAAVTMVLATAGIGNALADTWSGTDQSNNNNGNAYWYSYVGNSPSPYVNANTILTWENGFYNVGTTSYYPMLYYKQDTGNGLKTDPDGSSLGQYGYWWPNTASENSGSLVGSQYFIVNHLWGLTYGNYGSSVTYNQPYTVGI